MNVQEYIVSGIVESYVLGLASPEERREFESMCQKHPEVLQARTNFELILEQQAMQNALTPPSFIKEKVLEEIGSGNETTKIPEVPVRKMNWWKIAAAASIALLAGSLYWNVSLKKENERTRSELAENRKELAMVKEDRNNMMPGPSIRMASMKGLPIAPQAHATVYWDTTSHDVYLVIANLPKPATEQQYQLWALMDGKPIDIGMISNDYFIKQERLVIKARNVQNAQSFAISLEKKGGSTSPDGPQGDIYVLGHL